jgi:hypothetical protein
MKRKPEIEGPKYRYGLKRIWPVFRWCLCEMCHHEFRREGGWEILPGPFGFSLHDGAIHLGKRRYVCGECVPSRDEAKKIGLQYAAEVRNKRPPAPPPTGSGVQK